MIKFKVYYSDSEYEGSLEDAPQWDVIAIVQESTTMGREVLQSWDFYLFANGEWYGVEGMVDYVEHTMTQPIEKILKGRRIANAPYNEIIKRAHTDPGFLPKSSTKKRTEVGNQL